MPLHDPAMAHLLRRAGFGVSADEADVWNGHTIETAVDRLLAYEVVPDDVDDQIGNLGYLETTARGPFDPNNRITDARQRWLFRLVHTKRPLQEKMALFWHNHFATGFGKVAGRIGAPGASRAVAAKPSEDPSGVRGQLELFREHALGSFRDLLLAVSQDPAMVLWLDGDTNVKEKPQENALATLDRVELVAQYAPAVEYPDTGLGLALRAVAGALVQQVGTRVFWVQIGGFDTHVGQATVDGHYADLMTTLDEGLYAFYRDMSNQGLLGDTLVLQYSEFGRRVSENGSGGTDHGAAGLMMAVGGGLSGGLYGTAASLIDTPDNPTLENDG